MGTRAKASKELRENVPLNHVHWPSFSRKGRKKVPVGKTMILEQRLPSPMKSCVKHYKFRQHHLVYDQFCWSQHLGGFIGMISAAGTTPYCGIY
jgi:hypothetical protein